MKKITTHQLAEIVKTALVADPEYKKINVSINDQGVLCLYCENETGEVEQVKKYIDKFGSRPFEIKEGFKHLFTIARSSFFKPKI